MGARLTFTLVIAAAATLILGFVTRSAILIYVSIGCSVLAAIGLVASTRRRRQGAVRAPEESSPWTAALGGAGDDSALVSVGGRPVDGGASNVELTPAGGSAPAPGDDGPPVKVVGRPRAARRRSVRGGDGFDGPDAGIASPPTGERGSALSEFGPGGPGLKGTTTGGSTEPITPASATLAVGSWPSANSETALTTGTRDPAATQPPGARPVPVGTPAGSGAAWSSAAPPTASPPAASPQRPAPAWPAASPQPVAPRPPVEAQPAYPPARTPVAPPAAPARPPGPAVARTTVPPAQPAAPAAARPAAAAQPSAAASQSHPAATSRRPAPPPVEDYPFPIEDYDLLEEEDILPLLPHLYDEELVEVFLHERDTARRPAILDRLDSLLEGEG